MTFSVQHYDLFNIVKERNSCELHTLGGSAAGNNCEIFFPNFLSISLQSIDGAYQ